MANQCEETRVAIPKFGELGEFTAEDDSWIGGVVLLFLNTLAGPYTGKIGPPTDGPYVAGRLPGSIIRNFIGLLSKFGK